MSHNRHTIPIHQNTPKAFLVFGSIVDNHRQSGTGLSSIVITTNTKLGRSRVSGSRATSQLPTMMALLLLVGSNKETDTIQTNTLRTFVSVPSSVSVELFRIAGFAPQVSRVCAERQTFHSSSRTTCHIHNTESSMSHNTTDASVQDGCTTKIKLKHALEDVNI